MLGSTVGPRWVRVLLVAAALTGCGGGGGPAPQASQPPTPPAGGVSGLLPPALPRGGVLVNDASLLRPLRPGATWIYRGRYQSYTGAVAGTYENVVTHADAGAGAVVESASNAFNDGAGSQLLRLVAGRIESPAAIDFAGTGSPTSFVLAELQSPLYFDGQQTFVDRHFEDGGVDLDGDGRHDALDVAIFQHVVGPETLDLRNLPTLASLRIDTVTRARFQLSRDRTYTDVVEATQSAWYVAGVGIVRQRLDMPSATLGREVAEEELVSWDGLTEGLGAKPAGEAVVPSTSAVFPGETLGGVRAAVALADRAIVLTSLPGDPSGTGDVVLGALDKEGRVLQVRRRAGWLGQVQLLADGGGFGLLSTPPQGSTEPVLRWARYDAELNPLGSEDGVGLSLATGLLGEGLESAQGTVGDGLVWVAWVRRYVNANAAVERQLVVRAFDGQGQAALSERVIATFTDFGAPRILGLAANRARVVVTWVPPNGSANAVDVRYAVADAPFDQFRLDTLDAAFTGGNPRVLPFDVGVGIVWGQDLDTPTGRAAGVVLKADGTLERSTAGPLAGETLSVDWGAPLRQPLLADSRAGWLSLAGIVSDLEWPDSAVAEKLIVLDLRPAAQGSPLASSTGRVTRVRLDAPFYELRAQAVFDDRVLLLGGSSQRLATRAVWRWNR